MATSPEVREFNAQLDAWIVERVEAFRPAMEKIIMDGGDPNDPAYRLLLGQAQAYGKMRSYLHGARQTQEPFTHQLPLSGGVR